MPWGCCRRFSLQFRSRSEGCDVLDLVEDIGRCRCRTLFLQIPFQPRYGVAYDELSFPVFPLHVYSSFPDGSFVGPALWAQAVGSVFAVVDLFRGHVYSLC